MAKVNIYSTPTCTFCVLAKEFFSNNDVEFEEFDVAADEGKRNEMIEKTGQMGVPVIVVIKEDGGEEVVVGFDEGKLRELLEL
jgi:glutaredoxin 3